MKIILIILTSVSLLSCAGCKLNEWFNTLPRFPNIKTCELIKGATEEENILHCKLINGGAWEETIHIRDIPKVPTTEKEVVICTTRNNITALLQFRRELEAWIPKHCTN